MITPDLILSLALDGDDQSCMAAVGRPRRALIFQALRLADDPAVALAHPELVQRVRERVEAQRVKRSSSLLRNEGRV